MTRSMALSRGHGYEHAAGDDVVEDRSDAADRETEDEAFDVKAGGARKVEETRRTPVSRDEQGFGPAERGGTNARPYHGLPIVRECPEGGEPRHQERA